MIKIREPHFSDKFLKNNATAEIRVQGEDVTITVDTTCYMPNVVGTIVDLEVGLPSKHFRITGRFMCMDMKPVDRLWGDEGVKYFIYRFKSSRRPTGFMPLDANIRTHELILTTTE